MKTYEFTATVTSDGKLIIPEPYAKNVSAGDSVRVIVFLEEEISPAFAEASELPETLTLEEIVEEIRRSPQNPANVQPASGLLAEHLANSPETPDPTFDVAEWNRQY